MTISASYAPTEYTGDGTTVNFSTVWPFMDNTDIVVTEIVIATEVETVKSLGTHYTVTGGAGAVGTVVAVTAPASTVQWRIERATPRTQTTDFLDTGEFPIGTLETRLDRIVLAVQEIGNTADNAASIEYVDDSIASIESAVTAAEAAATASAASAAAAAVSAAEAAADLDAILGGSFADAPVSAAMQPVVASATLAAARTAMGVAGLADNNVFTGAATIQGSTTIDDTLLVTGAATVQGSTTIDDTLLVTGAATVQGATTIDDTVNITGAATIGGAAQVDGLFSANAGIVVAGDALETAAEVDVASATTTNLETAASNNIRITGTTTITGITLSAGHWRFVRFAAALTLTNGASLILPGGANITTSAGDTMLVCGEAAGVVRVHHYTYANTVAGGGKVAQVVRATWSTYTAFTDYTPSDNTIPQNTEGAERFTASITPRNASSTLLVEVELQCRITAPVTSGAGTVYGTIIGHLHRDSAANAIAAGIYHIGGYASVAETRAAGVLRIVHSESAGSTSATTFKVRSGKSVNGADDNTYAHNGITGALMGGVMVSSITITEILP